MDTAAVKRELVALEKKYWEALKDKDADAAADLTDETCIIAGAQGLGRITKDVLEHMMKNASYTLDEYELDDNEIQVELLRDDVALVAYKVREHLTVDGKPVMFDAADTSTWVRRDGGWRCAMHTEALSGDPFGRDRQSAERQPQEDQQSQAV